MFEVGRIYRRRDLHETYGGQQQGGISTPRNHPFLLLFTGGSGAQYGYEDTWTDDGTFEYTGEGQRGNMDFVRGNLAILQHAEMGKDLHLFESDKRAHVRYVGQMTCAGYRTIEGPDVDGQQRQVVVFELVPLMAPSDETDDSSLPPTFLQGLWRSPMPRLLELANRRAGVEREAKESRRRIYERAEAVRVYVLRRAGDECEGCGNSAPFLTKDGRPYLEPHHIRRISDGGPDDPAWVAGVCPNCHRRAHYAGDGEAYNISLKHIVDQRMARLSSVMN